VPVRLQVLKRPVWSRIFRGAIVASVLGALALLSVANASGTTTAPGTMTPAKVTAVGVSLKYPSDWVVVPLVQKELARELKLLAKNDPQLRAAIKQSVQGQYARYVKFLAVDRASPGGGKVTVSVLPEDIGDPGLDGFIPAFEALFAPLGATVTDSGHVMSVSGKAAYAASGEYTLRFPNGERVRERLGILVIPSRQAIVSALSRDDATGNQLVNDVLASVRLS